jgi:two-component system sensor histidine kinase/response regulator
VISQRRLFEQLALERLENALHNAELERDRLRLETHLQLALDLGGAGSWEYQHDHDRHTCSDGVLRIIGCSPDGARVNWPTGSNGSIPTIATYWPPPFDRIEQEGVQSQVIEYRVRHEDGHWLWVEDRSCVTERHADGRARITAGVLSDISARQKDRQQINSQNRALRMMSGIAQALIRQSDERQMLMEVCSVIVDIGGYHRAWIGEALPDADKSIRPVAHADGEEAYLAASI